MSQVSTVCKLKLKRTIAMSSFQLVLLISLAAFTSLNAREHSLLITDFNRDCAPDTLCGDINGDTVIPTQIRWGDHAPCSPEGDRIHETLQLWVAATGVTFGLTASGQTLTCRNFQSMPKLFLDDFPD